MPSGQDESLEGHRSAIQHQLEQYARSTYQAEKAASGAFAKDGKISLAVTGEKTNLKNFWSGRWTSSWTVAVTGQSCTISGDIKVKIKEKSRHLALLCGYCLMGGWVGVLPFREDVLERIVYFLFATCLVSCSNGGYYRSSLSDPPPPPPPPPTHTHTHPSPISVTSSGQPLLY